jgi:predicted metal-dependent peptidase
MTPRDKLAAGRIRTFDYCPYLASYVYSLKQQEARGTGTCGISKDGVLYWDPQFVDSLDVDTLAYVILHEALHLIFRHHARAEEVYGETPDPKTQFLMNVAGDLVIEQTLAFMRPVRPPAAVHLGAMVPGLGIKLDYPENLDMLEYFKRILADVQHQPQPDPQNPDGKGEDKADGDEAGGGSTACDKTPQKQSGKKGAATKPNGRAAACAPGTGGSAGDGVRRQSEAPDEAWSSFQESLNASKLEEAIAKHEQNAPGSVPGSLKESLRHFLRPQPDPFEHLRSVVASSTASPLGGRMPTYRRLSRKQPADLCRLRGQLTTQASAVVIVDTSGSMGDRETKEKALEVIARGLKKLRSVKVVCADTHVRSSVRLQDIANFEWVGGGGTSMDVALSEIDKTEHPDSIVLITDAATEWPSRPTRARVVVALTHPDGYWRERIPSWCKVVPLVSQA